MLLRPIVCAGIAMLVSVCAHAGRPLVTEDAGVLERGSCELESVAGRERASGAPATEGLSVQWGCGIGWRSQMALAAASARTTGVHDDALAVGGKTALNQPADGRAAWALAWGWLAVKPPGRSFSHEQTTLTGVLTQALSAELTLHANLGWSRSQSARASTTSWTLALEKSLDARLDVMGEILASDRDRSPWLQAGIRWAALAERLFIDGSLGMQTASAPPWRLTLGLKLAF